MDDIRYLDSATVTTLLDLVDPVEVVEDALRTHALKRAVLPAEAYLRWDTEDGWARSLTLPAALGVPAWAAGVKVINGNVDNPGRGVARASGLILLFDVLTGQVTTVLSAAAVSAVRTAAVSVAGARRLAPRQLKRALVIGAGPIGEAHVRLLHRSVSTLDTVWVHDLNPGRAAGLAGRTGNGGPWVRAVDDWSSVVGEADLVVCATTSTGAYLGLDDVREGALVVNVGLDDCAEDLLLGADHLVVDSWDLVADDDNRLLGRLIGNGSITRERVRAELGQLIAGLADLRPAPEDRVVLNPFGMAVNDIAVATVIEQLAVAKGAGLPLPR